MQHTHPDIKQYESLKALIRDSSNKELECRKFLQYVPNLLVKEPVIQLEYQETDYRGQVGDSDYVISARVKEASGFEHTVAYVWELKAPQCYIFKKETENRLSPSVELIKAENQLLHYFEELKGSEQFRAQFRVTRQDDVRIGGIIIGSKDKQVDAKFSVEKTLRLYEKALQARQHFYRAIDLRLTTWDSVLDFLSPPSSPDQIPGEPETLDKDAAVLTYSDFSWSG